jgi:hypothetical protein
MRKLATVSGVLLILLHSVSAQPGTGPGELVHGIAFASFAPLNTDNSGQAGDAAILQSLKAKAPSLLLLRGEEQRVAYANIEQLAPWWCCHDVMAFHYRVSLSRAAQTQPLVRTCAGHTAGFPISNNSAA